MKYQELEDIEKRIIKLVIQHPNINQADLGKKLNKTPRQLREIVHTLRCKGGVQLGKKTFMIIADNEGYNFEPYYTPRFNAWVDRMNSTITSYTEILNSI